MLVLAVVVDVGVDVGCWMLVLTLVLVLMLVSASMVLLGAEVGGDIACISLHILSIALHHIAPLTLHRERIASHGTQLQLLAGFEGYCNSRSLSSRVCTSPPAPSRTVPA